MPSLIAGVKSRLFIHSSQKSMHLLDGAFASLLHGRSLDFEDLREYEYGDEPRDIDWRATARLSTLLVKRSRATRMHTVLFLVDTGRGMRALAPDERPKSELAVLATGALGILTVRHGDDFSVVFGDQERVRRLAPGRSEAALEQALRTIQARASEATAESSRDALLDHVARTVSRRMIVVLVTDEAPVTVETERLLRRLRVQHDMLWVTLRDADPVLADAPRAGRRDADSGWTVPDFLHGDEHILQELQAARDAEDAHRHALLNRLRISHTALAGQHEALGQLLRMLQRRAHAAA